MSIVLSPHQERSAQIMLHRTGLLSVATDEVFVSPENAYWYAWQMHRRFPAGEHLIAMDAEYAFYYARDFIKSPWKLGEISIKTDPDTYCVYKKYFKLGDGYDR